MNIFEFDNYRDFLQYRYTQLKTQPGSTFSFRVFSDRAGFNSPNYLKLVMDGKRGLSDSAALKFGRGLGLNVFESEYLMFLSSYNQSRVPEKKRVYKQEMDRIKGEQVFLSGLKD